MGRAPCCDKDGLKKGPWLPEEDQKLIDYIQEHGPGNWRSLPKKAGLQRCGKSCRLRWTNYLRPDIKRGRFTFEEEEAIIQLHSILGNKWSAIAAKLPGRTDNEIKNYWNTHIRKRLLRMGIDPVTHTRRLDLLNLPSILNPPLQNPSQLNMLKLLGLQSLVNPELLRLATLLSTSHNENLNLLLQNHLQTNCGSNPMQNQFNPIVQNISHQLQIPLENTPIVGNAHVMEPKLEQYPENISGFDAQNLENQWQKNNILVNSVCGTVQDSCENNVEPSNNSLHVSDDRAFMDSLFDSCAFQPSSVLSSPGSSQQTPVHPNGSSSSSSEDETDSYCENLLNFDFPVDFFDVCRS